MVRIIFGKFVVKSDEGIFLDYSLFSKVYRIFNKRIIDFEESYIFLLMNITPKGG